RDVSSVPVDQGPAAYDYHRGSTLRGLPDGNAWARRAGVLIALRSRCAMPVMSDRWIRRMARDHGMIEPFVEAQKRQGVISYGLSSYGYDARVADEFKIFTNIDSAVIDPKNFAPTSFVDRQTDVCIIPPNSFAL